MGRGLAASSLRTPLPLSALMASVGKTPWLFFGNWHTGQNMTNSESDKYLSCNFLSFAILLNFRTFAINSAINS